MLTRPARLKTQAPAVEEPTGRLGPGVRLGVCLAVGLLCLVTIWAIPRPIGDLYVGLAAGRDIVQGRLAGPDDWSFMTQGRVWLNQNWGTHLLFYLFYRAGGDNGILVHKALMVLGMAMFMIGAARQRGAGWPLAILTAGAILAAARSYIDMRPNLTSLTFAPLVLWLIYLTRRRAHLFWLVAGAVWLWANMHGGFIFGLGMMGLWAGSRFISVAATEAFRPAERTAPPGAPRARGQSKAEPLGEPLWAKVRRGLAAAVRQTWPLFAATVAAVLLSGLANPFKLENLRHPFVVARIEAWRTVAEWRPVWVFVEFGTVEEFFTIIGVLAGLMALRITIDVAVRRKPITPEYVGMAVVSLILAMIVAVKSNMALTGPHNTMDDPPFPLDLIKTFEAVRAAYYLVGLLAVVAAICLAVSYRRFQRPSAELTAMVTFETVVVLVAIGMAMTSRRFIPLAIIMSAPFLAVQVHWLLKLVESVQRKFPGIVVAGVGGAIVFVVWTLDSAGWTVSSFSVLCKLAAGVVLIGAMLVEFLVLGGRVGIWPTLTVAAAVCVPVAIQARTTLLHYLPNNPRIPAGSVARRMCTYYMSFPPGAAAFINLNGINGRVFNEWRWEGFLRWECPQLQMFMGGRAQQAYDEDTFRLRSDIYVLAQHGQEYGRQAAGMAEGQDKQRVFVESLRRLEAVNRALSNLGMHLIVVPWDRQNAALIDAAFRGPWAIIYADGRNLVLADTGWEQARTWADLAIQGRLNYPDAASAKLSRAFCLATYRLVPSLPAGERQNNPAYDDAMAAAKGAAQMQRWPEAMEAYKKAHAALGTKDAQDGIAIATQQMEDMRRAIQDSAEEKPSVWLYEIVIPNMLRNGRLDVNWAVGFLAGQEARLKGMDVNRSEGQEILFCRKSIAGMLIDLYGRSGNNVERDRWNRIASEVNDRIDRLFREWE